MIKIFIPILLIAILLGYTNCGQVSNNNKTSTQAINPGDFGGDDGNQNTISAQALATIGLRVCNKMVALNEVESFETCISNVYIDEPTSAALGSLGVGRTIDDLITLANQGQIVVNAQASQVCFVDIDSYLRQNNPNVPPPTGTKDNLVTTQTSNNYNSQLAAQIISSSTACTNLFGIGTTF